VLVKKVVEFLNQPPYIERGFLEVSKGNAWMLEFAYLTSALMEQNRLIA